MQSKIISQQKNPFLHREEFVIEIKSNSNPSFDDVKKILAKDDELTIVKKISSNFGRKTFIAQALVYDSKEDKEKIEPKKKEKKAGESKPAQPVEEKKEESIKEPKKEAEQVGGQEGGDTKSESKQNDASSSEQKSSEAVKE